MNLFFPRVIFCLNNHATILIISKILVKNLWHGFTSIFFFPPISSETPPFSLICFVNIHVWFRANSHTIPLSSRRRLYFLLFHRKREPWKRDRIFAVEKMTKIRYEFGRHPVCGGIFGTRSLRKTLMGECAVESRVGAIIYIYCVCVRSTHKSYDLTSVYFVSLTRDANEISRASYSVTFASVILIH